MPRLSQADRIRQHLEGGDSLTQQDALDLYRCSRLAARIGDLRQLGLPIETESITVETRYGRTTVARYRLAQTGQAALDL